MDENKKDLNKIDELLESTSNDKRIKFDINGVKAVDGPEFNDDAEAVVPNTVEAKPIDETVEENITVEEPQGICIIDETSTTVIFEEGPDMTVDELVSPAKKAKSSKGKIKFKPIQIIIIAFLSLVTLWCIFYTTDHLLAAQGISPVFSRKVNEYEDGSVSYKGLGYKTQFKFDQNGALTQKVCPFWEEGPNDIIHTEP